MSRNQTLRRRPTAPRTAYGKIPGDEGQSVLAGVAAPGSGGKPKYKSLVSSAQIADMAQSMEPCPEAKRNGKRKKNKNGGRSKNQEPKSDFLDQARDLQGNALGSSRNRNQSGGFGAPGAAAERGRQSARKRRRHERNGQKTHSNHQNAIDVDAEQQATEVTARVPRKSNKRFAYPEPVKQSFSNDSDPMGDSLHNDFSNSTPLDNYFSSNGDDEQAAKQVTAIIQRKSKTFTHEEQVKQARSKIPEHFDIESEVDDYIKSSHHDGDDGDDFSLPVSKAMSPAKKRPSDLNRYKTTPNQRHAATATSSRHFSSTTRHSTQASPTIDLCNDNDSDDNEEGNKHSAIPLKKSLKDRTPRYLSVGSSVETTKTAASPPSGDDVRNIVQSIEKDKSEVYVQKESKFSLSQQVRGESSRVVDHNDTSTSNYSSREDTPPQKKTLLGSLKSTLQSGVNAVIDYVSPTNASGRTTVQPTVIQQAVNKRRRSKGTAIRPGGTLEKSTTTTISRPTTRSATKRKGWIDWPGKENDALSPSPKTKRSKRTNSTSTQPIELVDSSDEEEEIYQDVLRIAFGSRVYDQECRITFRTEKAMLLSFTNNRATRKSHSISVEDITGTKYFAHADAPENQDDSEKATFIALQVTKTKQNGLMDYSNVYKPEDDDVEKGYLVIELRSDEDFKLLRMQAKKACPGLATFLESSSELGSSEIEQYSAALIRATKAAEKKRRRVSGGLCRDGFLAGKNSEDLLLTFPFPVEKEKLDEAAAGLKELSGASLRDDDEVQIVDSDAVAAGDGGAADTEKKSRSHFLEIRVEDFDRLEPGEFLNDTLIDFFMQWMLRGDSSASTHIFSTHFYSALESDGAEGVKKWTMRKGINVFEKKFIFIPINKSLHWSICVVVNPGSILNLITPDGGNPDESNQQPCLLFFDSLKAHARHKVRKNVVKWLNSEWQRLKMDEREPDPFTQKAFKILAPKIPYQDNTWDCGVFACRYAYSLYQMRHRCFSFKELKVFGMRSNKIEMISDGPEFAFNMDDIARIREEMKVLIERLSGIYLPWRREMKRKEQEEKQEIQRLRLEGKMPAESNDDGLELTHVKAAPEPKAKGSPSPVQMPLFPDNTATATVNSPASSERFGDLELKTPAETSAWEEKSLLLLPELSVSAKKDASHQLAKNPDASLEDTASATVNAVDLIGPADRHDRHYSDEYFTGTEYSNGNDEEEFQNMEDRMAQQCRVDSDGTGSDPMELENEGNRQHPPPSNHTNTTMQPVEGPVDHEANDVETVGESSSEASFETQEETQPSPPLTTNSFGKLPFSSSEKIGDMPEQRSPRREHACRLSDDEDVGESFTI